MVAPAQDVLEVEAIQSAELNWRLERAADTADLPAGSVRQQLIAQIRALNPGAARNLLEQFEDDALSTYLDHLKLTIMPRGTRWVRSGSSPAISRDCLVDAED